MKRRANGEGTVYRTFQRVKKDLKGEECENCRNCKDRTVCNNRDKCSECDICKNCTKYTEYCDRYYFYDRWASQCSTKNGKRTSPVYSKNKSDVVKEKK